MASLRNDGPSCRPKGADVSARASNGQTRCHRAAAEERTLLRSPFLTLPTLMPTPGEAGAE
jgi:hypothetical protein